MSGVPVLAGFADRMPRSTSLTLSYLGIAVGGVIVAALLYVHAPLWTVLVAGAAMTIAVFMVRPMHFASLPDRFMCGVWVAMEDVPADAGDCAANIMNEIGTRKLFLAIHAIDKCYPNLEIRLRMILDRFYRQCGFSKPLFYR